MNDHASHLARFSDCAVGLPIIHDQMGTAKLSSVPIDNFL